MSRTIWWSPEARADLDRIDDYFADKDPTFANSVGDRAIVAAVFLADNPFAGAMVDGTHQRKWRVARSPYLLIYRPDGDFLRIMRVLHAAQDRRHI